MTPLELVLRHLGCLRLVIFDCDGVLIDSEPVAGRVVAEELAKLGWPITAEESRDAFLGLSLRDMQPIIERRIGRALPDAWRTMLTARLAAVLADEAVLVPGALAALTAAADLGLAWRIASNSSHLEMAAKFARVGLSGLVAGRLHSAADVAHPKPAPDVYLAAAAAEGVSATDCLVIEDSPVGMRAAAAAGMGCLAYAPHGLPAGSETAGAVPFADLGALPALFRAGLRRAA